MYNHSTQQSYDRAGNRPGGRRFKKRFGNGGQSGNNHFRGRNPNRTQRFQKNKSIDVSLFINSAKQPVAVVPQHIVERSFADFALHESIHRGIAARGYQTPTPIQDQSIDHILAGRDFLGIANTGTGKTGAFLIPSLNKIVVDRNHQVLIMVPTRELALQINREFRALAAGLNIYSVLCIGGTNMRMQERDLSRRYNILIGTPGRLKDVLQRNLLSISNVHTVILDEVDQMLDMGFIHDMREILRHLPQDRQSLFFSATMTKSVQQLIGDFSRELVSVSVKTHETADTIEQDVVRYDQATGKINVLQELLLREGFEKVLIFGRTKRGVHKLSQQLNERGFRTESIHGNKTQPQRQRALKRFHHNEVSILVATDVAARGLDIADVTHVINYDVPESYEDYVHRIGRTGRANKVGKALTLIEA